jgi:CheY-like chemotaxis protein
MRELVLVDSQAARVRLFREAIALYRDRFRTLAVRSDEARAKATEQVERARRASRAIDRFVSAERQERRGGDQPEVEGEDVRLHVFPSLREAIKFLRQEPPYEWAPRPAVVFTDLYLEGESGVALVREIKADRSLCALPAVVLCSGATAQQVREAWEAGSNAVVDLPGERPEMLGRVADTLAFWLQQAS